MKNWLSIVCYGKWSNLIAVYTLIRTEKVNVCFYQMHSVVILIFENVQVKQGYFEFI